MTDQSEAILSAVREAGARQCPLYISAGGSKQHIAGRCCDAETLDISAHRGIIDYQPGELVMTARAGTTLVEIVAALAAEDQILPFEPPQFDGRATLGGTLACNLSGPARPWYGSVRDTVLGTRLINGKAELLKFGGQVMKNVAGYDVSRLQAGALGTLGIMTEISIRLLPRPEATVTLRYEMSAPEAVAIMNQRAGQPRPLSGAFWLDGEMYLRISGAASAVKHTADLWGGDQLDHAQDLWAALRDMSLPFFAGDAPLWRLSQNSSAPPSGDPAQTLIDWGGAQRWLRGDFSLPELQRAAQKEGGHATLFCGGNRNDEVRPTPGATAQRLQQRLKYAFDPQGILNPGRLYGWL